MQITVNLPDELAAQVQAQAVIDQRRPAVEAVLQFAEKYGFTTGGQNLKSMIHKGHKY